ncbi:MAG: O-antigen ligase family protein [Deltaproteobacteria bacterium]|nr:O-antigen ligase family protein [Candidatus Zymogenaceae bacterium]
MEKRIEKPDVNSIILVILIALLPLIFRFSPIPFFGKFFGHKIQLLEILFPPLVVVWFFSSLRQKTLKPVFPPGTIFFLAFVGVSFISSMLSIDTGRACIETAGYVYLYLLYFFFYNLIVDESHVNVSLRCFLVISFVIGMIGIVGLLLYTVFDVTTFPIEVFENYLGIDLIRIRSTFFTSNYFLSYMGFACAVSIPLIKYDEKKWIRVLASLLILMVVAILLTALYRGAFVIWGILFFGLRYFKNARAFVFLRVAAAGLFLAFFLLFALQGYINISPVEISHDASSHRLETSISTQPSVYANLHLTAIHIIREHPLVGVGPGLYNEYMNRPEFGYDFETYPWTNLDPHSTYLGYCAETGVFGVLFLLLFFGSIIVHVSRAKTDTDMLRSAKRLFLAYFVLMLVYALFVDIFTLRFLYFAYALSLSLGGPLTGGYEKER